MAKGSGRTENGNGQQRAPLLRRGRVSGPPHRAAGIGLDEAPVPARPLPPDSLVVVEIVDGYADTSLVHLPAAEKSFGGHDQIVFRFADLKWAPRSWPSRCGIVGDVYNHGGILEGAPVCGACQAAA